MPMVDNKNHYGAFISYSHAVDSKLGDALRYGLVRFGKPWYRYRALRVFLDKTNLALNPALWSSIQHALTDSEYFVLLASKSAAASKWVRKELEFWLRIRSSSSILIVLTDELISIRSRGKFERPFTRVQELQRKAQDRVGMIYFNDVVLKFIIDES